MNEIFELIKRNSSNEEYVIGDAFLELLPIDFIRPSGLGSGNVKVCSEIGKLLDEDFCTMFSQVEELISNNNISFSKLNAREMIGSFGPMRLRTDPEHVEKFIKVRTTNDVWEVLSSHYTVSEC